MAAGEGGKGGGRSGGAGEGDAQGEGDGFVGGGMGDELGDGGEGGDGGCGIVMLRDEGVEGKGGEVATGDFVEGGESAFEDEGGNPVGVGGRGLEGEGGADAVSVEDDGEGRGELAVHLAGDFQGGEGVAAEASLGWLAGVDAVPPVVPKKQVEAVFVEPRGEADEMGDVSRSSVEEDDGGDRAGGGDPPAGKHDVVRGAELDGLEVELEVVGGQGDFGDGVVEASGFKAPESDKEDNGEDESQEKRQNEEEAEAPEEGCQFLVHKDLREGEKVVDKGGGLPTGGVVDGLPRRQGDGQFTGRSFASGCTERSCRSVDRIDRAYYEDGLHT